MESPTLMGVRMRPVEGPMGSKPKQGMFEQLSSAGKARDTGRVSEVCAFLVESSKEAPLGQVRGWADKLQATVQVAKRSWNSSVLMMVQEASKKVEAAYSERTQAADSQQDSLNKDLRKAAAKGDLAEVKRLVEAGADPAAKDKSWPYDNAVSAAMGREVYDTLPVVDDAHREVVDYLAPMVREKLDARKRGAEGTCGA